MARRLGALFLAVLVGALAGYQVRQADLKRLWVGGRDGSPPAAAPRNTTVKAEARIEPQGGIISVGATPGIRIAAVLVKEGDEVEKDAVLVELDGRADRQREIDMIESQVGEAKAALKVEDDYAAALKDEIAIEKEQADKVDPLEIQMQTASVEELTARKASEAKELTRVKGLRAQNLLSRQEEEQTELLLGRTTKELEAAQQLLEKLKAGHDLSRKRLAVAQRKADLTSARARLAVRVESLQKSLELARGRLDQSVVKAPVKGTVLKLHTHPGEVIGARPILQLGELSRMDVVAEVHEDSRSFVKVGQKAMVTSPALPDRPGLRGQDGKVRLTGTVSRIGWTVAKNDVLGLDPAADAYARVVEVHIALDPAQSAEVKHLTNLQVTVAIDTAADGRTEGR
jgi:HlyD family secretion protein